MDQSEWNDTLDAARQIGHIDPPMSYVFAPVLIIICGVTALVSPYPTSLIAGAIGFCILVFAAYDLCLRPYIPGREEYCRLMTQALNRGYYGGALLQLGEIQRRNFSVSIKISLRQLTEFRALSPDEVRFVIRLL